MNKPITPKYSPEQTTLAAVAQIKEIMAQRVIDLLFEEATQELAVELSNITIEHNKATNTAHPSFIYRSKYYNEAIHPAENPLDLHASLHVRMDEYLEQVKQINQYEVPVIRGILKSMFMASDRISDYKQILPEQVHSAFDHITNIPQRRTMLPQEIAKMQKRLEPFLTVMKGRMLQNRLVNRSQP